MKRFMIFLALLGVTGLGPRAQDYFEVPDVPTDLPAGGTTFLPWDIVDNSAGVYAVAAPLPPNTPVDAVHLLPTGDWLLSVEVPTDLGGTTWDPRDVFLWDGAVLYAAYPPYAGAVGLIPPGSDVDAAFLDPSGAVVVSFDVPTTVGATTYDPADLIRYNGVAFDAVPYFDASAAGIPTTTNLTAAGLRGLLTILSLDVPTTVGIATFLPGEVLSWNGGALGVFDPQPGWPVERSSRVNALTFDATPFGTNPGADLRLTVERLGAAMLRLTWTASDCGGGIDTGIYQGSIASLHLPIPVYDHTMIDCTDSFPFLQANIPLPAGDAYFVLSAHNDPSGEEGSYGLDNPSVGPAVERPVGLATCVPVQALSCPS